MSSGILIEKFIDKNAEACTQFLLFYYKHTSAYFVYYGILWVDIVHS